MIFQDNIIKEYLKNVYFITGTACGGKTTLTKALVKKYNLPVYVIDERFEEHQAISDSIHQPNMNRQFKDADEFFGRSVEEYKKWLLENGREQLDFILLDLIRLSQNQIYLCDIHCADEEVMKFSDPSRVVFMLKYPEAIVDEYSNRPDHKPFHDFLHSATDYEKAKATCNETLYSLNIDFYNFVKNSDYFWLERDNNRSVDETVEIVAKHFGFDRLFEKN
ncbi:MAG: ATP-binding protein [Lachnospiraceae bacterium]|nr:ATP-binding protein [Lachnospiraceae bacterium]